MHQHRDSKPETTFKDFQKAEDEDLGYEGNISDLEVGLDRILIWEHILTNG